MKLSVQILTQNSEENIRRCLESVRFADELQVVDGGSEDGTLDICREYDAKILQHPYENYGNQQNWGLPHLTHDWTLVIDSDEWLSEQLQKEIRQLLSTQPEMDGYFLRRRSFFMGKEIRYSGWQNDTVLRFFNRRKASFRIRQVHSDCVVDGQVGRLEGLLYHKPYANLHDYFKRIQRYTDWAAEEFCRQGRNFHYHQLFLHPPAKFFKMYLLRLGILDGFHGLILAILSTFYVFMKYLKIWEKQKLSND